MSAVNLSLLSRCLVFVVVLCLLMGMGAGFLWWQNASEPPHATKVPELLLALVGGLLLVALATATAWFLALRGMRFDPRWLAFLCALAVGMIAWAVPIASWLINLNPHPDNTWGAPIIAAGWWLLLTLLLLLRWQHGAGSDLRDLARLDGCGTAGGFTMLGWAQIRGLVPLLWLSTILVLSPILFKVEGDSPVDALRMLVATGGLMAALILLLKELIAPCHHLTQTN